MRAFWRFSSFLACVGLTSVAFAHAAAGARQNLDGAWQVQSSVLAREDGAHISNPAYEPKDWVNARVPTTVLNALVKNGTYPDPRFALNSFLLPDASDEFNQKQNLARYSHLPDHRNPWTAPLPGRTSYEWGAAKSK